MVLPETEILVTLRGPFASVPDMLKSEGVAELSVTASDIKRVMDVGVAVEAYTRVGDVPV